MGVRAAGSMSPLKRQGLPSGLFPGFWLEKAGPAVSKQALSFTGIFSLTQLFHSVDPTLVLRLKGEGTSC